MITLPRKIHLIAMRAHWKVSYVKSPGKLTMLEYPGRVLTIYGKNYSKRAAYDLIIRWIQLKAYYHFSALLRKLNRQVKVNYKKLIIRSQATCWGSYMSTGTISLNYQLMFLPPVLVKHLAIHELCHARHQTHSPKFWKEVGKFDRNWKTNRDALFDADVYIPRWISS